ncbi:DUF899 domain-containing protein [Pseudonocardia humida]|uniref:DUF899 domain-containing protein n=1 Tax=Pseudonocardia humida TaxID=2800819 RepID=A0ABT1AD03_9PSEU|nr:DUF899 domain-containing protein [Pseudonocardia humida]MCO1660922.1 DUF899 domain-containing protein [Pseudonocardia humida]
MTNLPEIVSREEWLAARIELLAREKELTRARDELNAARRELPMVRVDEPYVFEGPAGPVTLLEMFEGRRQLLVHHFMWNYDLAADGTETPKDVGCPSCSATADDIGDLTHLHVRDTTLAAVSRAPQDKIGPFRARMGWSFPWYSSAGTAFNHDFHATVDERVAPVLLNYRTERQLAEVGVEWGPARRGDYPGLSAFVRDGDEVFHTYSTFARGLEQPGGTSAYLDLTALGRQEAWERPPGRASGTGAGAGSVDLRFHDEYDPRDVDPRHP